VRGWPDAGFEAVRFAVYGKECATAYLWGSTNEPDRLGTALQSDPAIDEITRLSRAGSYSLYAMERRNEQKPIVNAFVETAAPLPGFREDRKAESPDSFYGHTAASGFEDGQTSRL